ncbi:MAG TPA: hypothetical protein VFI22_12230, partial [Thermomicrobiales bacterium]|nr:hypothetical protein [Thermomicrobiales bacterium]
SYTDEQTALYRRLAEERGLLISCGSDSHAPKQPVDPRPWHAAWCAALLDRLGVAVAPVPDGEPVWAPGGEGVEGRGQGIDDRGEGQAAKSDAGETIQSPQSAQTPTP